MPYTLNGCGTKYYGDRDRDADGSYVTTEWIVLMFIPLIPIGSFRVRLVKSGFMSSEYLTQRIPFQWLQIRNIYLAELAALTIYSVASLMFFRHGTSPNLEPPKDVDRTEQSR